MKKFSGRYSGDDVMVKKVESRSEITFKLLKDLRIGDERAFEKIYNLYYKSILRFLNNMLRSTELAEDITQELFINIWEHYDMIDPNKNFQSYLFTSAKNRVVDFYRKKKEVIVENEIPLDLIEEIYSDDILIADDTWQQIIRIVNQMPKQRQKIFMLSRHEQMSNEEIAQHLQITKNAVEKHISFALRDIRMILQNISKENYNNQPQSRMA